MCARPMGGILWQYSTWGGGAVDFFHFNLHLVSHALNPIPSLPAVLPVRYESKYDSKYDDKKEYEKYSKDSKYEK